MYDLVADWLRAGSQILISPVRIRGEVSIAVPGQEFVEMFVGVEAASVCDLFEQERGRAAAIIFVNEWGALDRARGIGPA